VISKEIRKELKLLIKKNIYNNVIALLFDWFVIFSSILISVTFNNILIYLVAIILIGSRMRAFDNLMHEACHRSLFTNKFWNKWIACLFVAFPVFTSYTAYRNAHHCTGFFKTTLPGFYSVVKDIFTPNYERKES